MLTQTEKAFAAILQVADAIVETVAEFPEGAPATPLYLAMQARGISHENCEKLMSGLVAVGKLRKSGHRYFVVARP